MENSGNESNKKAIMKVLCAESHSEQINIYVTSGRFSGRNGCNGFQLQY